MNEKLENEKYVGRLAPSPTGALHLGNVRTFMIAWLRARVANGKIILRMEDLDHPKDKPGAAAQAIEDLKWLGFDWDEEYVQSSRRDFYRDQLAKLKLENRVYPCVCTRRDVENAQSAPHAGEQLFYPGTCRDRFATWEDACAYTRDRTPCWRFKVATNETVSFDDVFVGHQTQNVATTLGDFPLARDIDGAGYTLAAVADDLAMGVTEVVRGDDLLAATPAQILVAKALGASRVPAYCHVPLLVGRDGRRLAKRHGDTRIASYRDTGIRPEEIISRLARESGFCSRDEVVSLRDLIPKFSLSKLPHSPLIIV